MYVCNLYLTEYEMLLTISNCACTCIDPRWVRSRSPTMLSTPLVVRLLGERERSCNRAGILYSMSQDNIMFYVLLFNRHLSTFHKPCSFLCKYHCTNGRATRIQQLTLYHLASGMTDGRVACLQHGQPAAVPSVGDDRRRERLTSV